MKTILRRRLAILAVSAVGALVLCCRIPVLASYGQVGGAPDILRAVRDALGGPRLAQVRSLMLEGDARYTFEDLGGYVAPGRREVRLSCPDDYLVVNHYVETDVTSGIGLRHNTLFRIEGPSVNLAPKEVQEVLRRHAQQKMRREATLLLAALLLTTDTPLPIRCEYAGRAKGPDGAAEAIDIIWSEGLAARLFVEADTKLPLLLTFEDLEIRKRPPPGSFREMTFPMPEFDKVPQAWYFSDHRRVDGILVPHAWIHTVAGATRTQFTVTRARVNVARILDAFPK